MIISILNSYQLHVTCKFGYTIRIPWDFLSWLLLLFCFWFLFVKKRWIACMVKDSILMTSIGEKEKYASFFFIHVHKRACCESLDHSGFTSYVYTTKKQVIIYGSALSYQINFFFYQYKLNLVHQNLQYPRRSVTSRFS